MVVLLASGCNALSCHSPVHMTGNMDWYALCMAQGDDWSEHVVTDGKLVTGQNPQSSEGVAKAVLAVLKA